MRNKLLSLFAASLLLAASASAIAGPAPDTPQAANKATYVESKGASSGTTITITTTSTEIGLAADTIGDGRRSVPPTAVAGVVDLVTIDRIGHALGGAGQLQLVLTSLSTMIMEGADGTPTAVVAVSELGLYKGALANPSYYGFEQNEIGGTPSGAIDQTTSSATSGAVAT